MCTSITWKFKKEQLIGNTHACKGVTVYSVA